MGRSIFQTNPMDLHQLLLDCHRGTIQLPDFQRSWVWDEDRIKSLIASVSRAFPVGAVMSLQTGGPVNFKPRPIEGAPPEAKSVQPQSLLLDGQQRLTSLYQVALRDQVVATVTPRSKKVRRWFYIDMVKALDPSVSREDAVLSIPEDRIVRHGFGREIELDLSSRDKEIEQFMYPVNKIFDREAWGDAYYERWYNPDDKSAIELWHRFKSEILENFQMFRLPVIVLDRETSKEAVCTVFEKVNTGGKPLDAFELVTALYAASGHELRKDWYGDGITAGREQRFKDTVRHADTNAGILEGVRNTDFLQAISLFYTRDRRRDAELAGKSGKELPAVSANRQALLDLPLSAYLKYETAVENGFVKAAKFLNSLNIFQIKDLPYQSQIVPLAAILTELGDQWEHDTARAKLMRWYWCGVFGEMYGSTVETRIAKDFIEVPEWIRGGDEPATVIECNFRADRLKTMRMRLSAAYKGVNVLLMKEGARDFRSGQKFDLTVFFGENVDIHHIFPEDWCKKQGIARADYDSIINKTPLSYRTNRIIGGVAPSAYLLKLENGSKDTPPIPRDVLNSHLKSHLIDPEQLLADDYNAFMASRQRKLIALIENATGKQVQQDVYPEEGTDMNDDELRSYLSA